MKYSILFLIFCLILSAAPLHAQDSFEDALEKHVKILSSPSMDGRAAGSAGELKAAAYIAKSFKDSGLEWMYPNGYQDFSFVDPATSDTLNSQNVVAVVQGYDPKLRDEYIVVGAHYDQLGTYTMRVNGKDSTCIYPGADENASGVAALLELAAAAQQRHFLYKRSIIFVAFGAGEKGYMGSWYFTNRAFPVSQVKMMVNLDRMGRSGANNEPMAFTGQSQYELERLLIRLTSEPYMPQVQVYGTNYFISDHQSFMDSDVPVCVFTTGMHQYHNTLRDIPQYLDYAQMDAFCQYIMLCLMETANGDDQLFVAEETQTPTDATQQNVFAYAEVDKAPQFMKNDVLGFSEQWIYKYLKYPEAAVRQGIRGRVMVAFIIEKDGSVTNVEVTHSVDPLLDDEAVRVISASPKWKPGEMHGEKVRVKVVVPVYFELTKRKR